MDLSEFPLALMIAIYGSRGPFEEMESFFDSLPELSFTKKVVLAERPLVAAQGLFYVGLFIALTLYRFNLENTELRTTQDITFYFFPTNMA